MSSDISDDEKKSFLHDEAGGDEQPRSRLSRWFDPSSPLPWKISTALLAILLIGSLLAPHWKETRRSYETGFDTDLQPANSAIRLRKTKFSGGVIVNETGQFELVVDPGSPTYVGKPTRELDAAWDRLVGTYTALTNSEVKAINGHFSEQGGKYLVVTHGRHSLHCVNYLRKVAYDKWYPTVRTESKPTIPTFYQHVDHCIETLRQTIQCHSDMTPVPHIWSEGKQMYLADTSLEHTCRDYNALLDWQDQRDEAWKLGKLTKES